MERENTYLLLPGDKLQLLEDTFYTLALVSSKSPALRSMKSTNDYWITSIPLSMKANSTLPPVPETYLRQLENLLINYKLRRVTDLFPADKIANCQFYAVSQALYKTINRVKQLRTAAVDWLRKNQAYTLVPFFFFLEQLSFFFLD